MFIKSTKILAALSAVLALSACGGLDEEAAPHLLATAAPLSSGASLASAAPVFSAVSGQGSAKDQAEPPVVAAAEGSGNAFRVLAWEQSISLEMNRRHEEQLARVAQAQPGEADAGATSHL